MAEAATAYDLRPHASTKQALSAAADGAATRLEDVARKIERLISQNSSRSTRRAARMLAEIREDLIPEMGGYKGRIYH